MINISRATTAVGLNDWRHVHNMIIPADPLSVEDVAERAGQNLLHVIYLGTQLVGCSTVRPPVEPGGTATVIARILPEFRRRGFGTSLHEAALAEARGLGSGSIETIVWAPNIDGLRFADKHGYAEIERYVLEGDEVPYVTLRLAE